MNQRDNLTIGVLSITAVVLLVGVLLAPGWQAPAYAIGQLDRGGDYIMLTGQFSKSSEMVYLIDAAAQQLNAYSYDWNRGILVIWDSHDLKRAFGQRRAPAGRN